MNKRLFIGIDCFNISEGGGLTHLNAILKEFDKLVHKEVIIILWGSSNLLNKIPSYNWLLKKTNLLLNLNIVSRLFWHIFFLKLETQKFNIDILLSPGGICVKKNITNIVMFRNVLPFIAKEINKYNILKIIRFKIFKFLSIYSFKNSNGIIYLSNWSQNFIENKIGINNLSFVIPHGVKKIKSKNQQNHNKSEIKLIYVSHTSPYKNYDYVINNLIQFALKNNKINLSFTSIGEICDGFNPENWKLKVPSNLNLNFVGKTEHYNTLEFIRNSDICIFASSAENFPNVLLEYMSAGSVCLCNEIEPMKSILGNAGIFFNMKLKYDLQNKLQLIYQDGDLQKKLKDLSKKRSLSYTWENTAKLTLKFCYEISKKNLKI